MPPVAQTRKAREPRGRRDRTASIGRAASAGSVHVGMAAQAVRSAHWTGSADFVDADRAARTPLPGHLLPAAPTRP